MISDEMLSSYDERAYISSYIQTVSRSFYWVQLLHVSCITSLQSLVLMVLTRDKDRTWLIMRPSEQVTGKLYPFLLWSYNPLVEGLSKTGWWSPTHTSEFLIQVVGQIPLSSMIATLGMQVGWVLIMLRIMHQNIFGEILMKMDRRITLLEELLPFEKEDRKVSL